MIPNRDEEGVWAWLLEATKGLTPADQKTVQLELLEHYREAIRDGIDADEAFGSMGNAYEVRRKLMQSHLSPVENFEIEKVLTEIKLGLASMIFALMALALIAVFIFAGLWRIPQSWLILLGIAPLIQPSFPFFLYRAGVRGNALVKNSLLGKVFFEICSATFGIRLFFQVVPREATIARTIIVIIYLGICVFIAMPWLTASRKTPHKTVR